jgi:hypothetical protein
VNQDRKRDVKTTPNRRCPHNALLENVLLGDVILVRTTKYALQENVRCELRDLSDQRPKSVLASQAIDAEMPKGSSTISATEKLGDSESSHPDPLRP